MQIRYVGENRLEKAHLAMRYAGSAGFDVIILHRFIMIPEKLARDHKLPLESSRLDKGYGFYYAVPITGKKAMEVLSEIFPEAEFVDVTAEVNIDELLTPKYVQSE